LLFPNTVELLLKNGANIEEQDILGLTPLMFGNNQITKIYILFKYLNLNLNSMHGP
jgi:hypothetical protein